MAANVTGILNPKDYSLTTLSLLTPAGVFDMRYVMMEMSYQEDLFSNTVHGYMFVVESSAYAELLNLTGNEFLRFSFNKDGNTSAQSTKNQIDKTFRVYKMDNRKLSGNMNTESYCLYFCSEEMMLSEQYKVSKSYPNKDISSIVTDICTKYLGIPDNKLHIDSTYGNYSFVVPTLKPFDAINWLSTYARPGPKIPGADMVFFENKEGFNFKSIQSLSDSDNAVFYNIYTYDPKNINNKNLEEEVLNVTTYEILSSYDALGEINSGMFANKLISADILTRTKKETSFDYLKYWNDDNTGGLNPHPITNNYTNRKGDKINDTDEACLKMVFSNFNQSNPAYTNVIKPGSVAGNIFAETYIPNRTAQLALANHTRVKMSVPGDPNLTVGVVIDFQLISKNPAEKLPDKFYSGNYLVTAIRHIINQSEYKTVMEVAKDSSQNQYADVQQDSPLWKSVSGKGK